MDENFAFAGHRCGMLAFREGEHHQIGGKHLRLESAATGRLGDWADWSARQPRTSHHVDAQKPGGQRPALAGPGSPRGFTKECAPTQLCSLPPRLDQTTPVRALTACMITRIRLQQRVRSGRRY